MSTAPRGPLSRRSKALIALAIGTFPVNCALAVLRLQKLLALQRAADISVISPTFSVDWVEFVLRKPFAMGGLLGAFAIVSVALDRRRVATPGKVGGPGRCRPARGRLRPRERVRAMTSERVLHVPALIHGRVLVRDPQPTPAGQLPLAADVADTGSPASGSAAVTPASAANVDAPPWQPTPLDPADGAGAPLLLVCHGYGEGPEAALAAAARIPGIDTWRVAAPQGLHRFYTKTGDVVASWMTKQDRDYAIADNLGYLAQTLAALAREHGVPRRLVIAGFSQGAAMAWRAAVRCGWRVDALVVHGGDLPADVVAEVPAALRVLVGRGVNDTWYGEDKLTHDLDRLAARGVTPAVVRFAGGHEWGDELVAAVGSLLAAVAD